MISSTISFLLAILALNSVSISLAAPIRFTPRDNADALAPRAHTPGVVDNKILRRIVQKDAGINELHNSPRGDPITIVSSVTTVVQDGKKPGTIDLISTTTTVVEKGNGKKSCSGQTAQKKSCGKGVGGAKPGKKCGKKIGPAAPSSGTNSTTVPPGPSNDGNSTVIPDVPPSGSSNSTSTPPTMQSLPILPDGPTDDPLSNGTVLVQDSNNSNSTTAVPGDAPEPQPVRRRANSVSESISGSEPPKPREVKQRLDKRNRMSFSET